MSTTITAITSSTSLVNVMGQHYEPVLAASELMAERGSRTNMPLDGLRILRRANTALAEASRYVTWLAVHSRTPISLGFRVELPSVEARGRRRERGRVGRRSPSV